MRICMQGAHTATSGCVRASMRVRVHFRLRAFMRACVCVCVRALAVVRVSHPPLFFTEAPARGRRFDVY